MELQAVKPTTKQLRQLSAFLDAPERPAGTLGLNELRGFLFAVHCSPETIMPSEWLPMLFGDEELGFADEAEASRILPILMGLYNDIARQNSPNSRRARLPNACRPRQPASRNYAEDAPRHHS